MDNKELHDKLVELVASRLDVYDKHIDADLEFGDTDFDRWRNRYLRYPNVHPSYVVMNDFKSRVDEFVAAILRTVLARQIEQDADENRDRVARAICEACGENPDHTGDCRGNEWRWQDYRAIAQAAINAYEAF